MFEYVAFLGPTASGKTQIAIDVAKQYPVEIISVDSVSVYKELNIGSAKPSIEQMQGIPHHLISCVDLNEVYTVARFVKEANELIREIRARKRIPLLCGGTMMYAHALKEGLSGIPEVNPEVLEQVEQQYTAEGLEGLYQHLVEVDPQAAKQFHSNDKQRIMRALSLVLSHQKPLGRILTKGSPVWQGRFILQRVIDREAHRHILAQRVDLMISNGFYEEVEEILRLYGRHISQHPAMRSIGYKQIIEMQCGTMSISDVREKIITASAQLVKKQMTWINAFKSKSYQYVRLENAEDALKSCLARALESL